MATVSSLLAAKCIFRGSVTLASSCHVQLLHEGFDVSNDDHLREWV